MSPAPLHDQESTMLKKECSHTMQCFGTKPSPCCRRIPLPKAESKANPTTSSQQNKNSFYDLLSQEDIPAGFAPSRGLCSCKSALPGQLYQSHSFTIAPRASLLEIPQAAGLKAFHWEGWSHSALDKNTA